MTFASTRLNRRITICRECSGVIHWQDCPTGGWWFHYSHPEDHHDARGPGMKEVMDDHGDWVVID